MVFDEQLVTPLNESVKGLMALTQKAGHRLWGGGSTSLCNWPKESHSCGLKVSDHKLSSLGLRTTIWPQGKVTDLAVPSALSRTES